jgi:hypothetical protein
MANINDRTSHFRIIAFGSAIVTLSGLALLPNSSCAAMPYAALQSAVSDRENILKIGSSDEIYFDKPNIVKSEYGSSGNDVFKAPRKDFIYNETIALKIADIILRSRFGDARIDSQLPLNCILEDGVWIITGTFKENDDKSLPPKKGGVAEIHISKKTGEILVLGHGK